MKQFIVCVVVAHLLAACATPYQEMGFLGGVEVTQLDERTLRVRGKGNAYTDATTTQDHVLLRTAEETLRLGFTLFSVVDEQNTQKVIELTKPAQSTSYTTGSATAYGTGSIVTASGSATTTTTYTPSETTYITKPRTAIVAKMYTGEMPENPPPSLYSAASIVRFLGGKYYKK